MSVLSKILRQKTPVETDVVRWRRHLHAHPELSFQEFETTEFICKKLEEFGIAFERPTETGAVATVRGTAPAAGGKPVTVAIRADIDALPIHEENDLPYRSTRDGVMHACGHDAHTATLLGLASLINEHKSEFSGTVKFLFQPAEELPPGGARAFVEAGVLQGVDRVIGLHYMSDIPVGRAAIRSGPMMAHSDRFNIFIEGRGGHGASPHRTVDSVIVASQLVQSLQTIVSRRLNPLAPAVVTVGSIKAGTTFNVIAQRAELKGTTRCFDDGVRDMLEAEVRRISEHTCAQYGAECRVEYERGYPAVVNDPDVTRVMWRAAEAELGAGAVYEPPLTLGGEDFAYYLKEVPGAFLFVGAGSDGSGARFPHHHPRFNIDEKAMAHGLGILARSAFALLEGGPGA